MSLATTVERLKTIRDNLARVIDEQVARWVVNGMPPDSFSIDGESYNWADWIGKRTKELSDLNEAIAALEGPTMAVSRGRV